MTLQDTGNFRRRLAAFLDPTNPNLNQIEPYPSVMGGEVKPPFVSTMPYFGGGSMEPIGPYIPTDDNQGIELFGGGNRMAANFGDLKDYEKKILQDGLRIRQGHPSYDNEKLRLIKQYPGFQAKEGNPLGMTFAGDLFSA